MGVMYEFICPARRQYVNPCTKYSTLMENGHALGVGLLLCDERRVHDGPLSIAGSWAGCVFYIVGDSDGGPLEKLGLTDLITEAKAADPSELGALDDLYHFAYRRFEDIATPIEDALEALLPGADRSDSHERMPNTFADAVGPYAGGEQFCVVCPEMRQYVDPSTLGERTTIDRVFLGWPGRAVGDLILRESWAGPIYTAGSRSQSLPLGIPSQTTTTVCQNLYAIAHAEYEEVTLEALQIFHHTQDVLDDAASSDRLFVAIGDAAYGSGGSYWKDGLTRTLGKEWPKHWANARKRLGM
jgi:hypothetical protein